MLTFSILKLQNYEINNSYFLVPVCHLYIYFPLNTFSPFLLRGPYNPMFSFAMPFSRSAMRKKLTSFMIFFLGEFRHILSRFSTEETVVVCLCSLCKEEDTWPLFIQEKTQWQIFLPDKRQLPRATLPGTPGQVGPQEGGLKLWKILMKNLTPWRVYRVSQSLPNIASQSMYNYSAFRYTMSISRIFEHRLISDIACTPICSAY